MEATEALVEVTIALTGEPEEASDVGDGDRPWTATREGGTSRKEVAEEGDRDDNELQHWNCLGRLTSRYDISASL